MNCPTQTLKRIKVARFWLGASLSANLIVR
jgi:hypothetical protein